MKAPHSALSRAGLRLGGTLLLVLFVTLLPRAHVVWLALPTLLLGVTTRCGQPPLQLARRVLLLEPFALGVALLALWQPEGLPRFLQLVARSTLSLWALVLLTSTTSFGDLLLVLRRLRFPALLVTTLALMYRYLWVLQEELVRMQRARASRTTGPLAKGLRWHLLSQLAALLFIRSSERAERIYAAMCARGWR